MQWALLGDAPPAAKQASPGKQAWSKLKSNMIDATPLGQLVASVSKVLEAEATQSRGAEAEAAWEQEVTFFESSFRASAAPSATKRRKRVTRKPIFISYPRQCKELAMSLWKDLESEEGMSCWIDVMQREKKELWRCEIGEAIQACECMVWVIAGGEGGSVNSQYCIEDPPLPHICVMYDSIYIYIFK